MRAFCNRRSSLRPSTTSNLSHLPATLFLSSMCGSTGCCSSSPSRTRCGCRAWVSRSGSCGASSSWVSAWPASYDSRAIEPRSNAMSACLCPSVLTRCRACLRKCHSLSSSRPAFCPCLLHSRCSISCARGVPSGPNDTRCSCFSSQPPSESPTPLASARSTGSRRPPSRLSTHRCGRQPGAQFRALVC